MLRLARLILQVVLFFLLVSVVIGVASGDTGTAEKAVLAAIGIALVWAASFVRRLGRRTAAPL